jgi:hypothetical protein
MAQHRSDLVLGEDLVAAAELFDPVAGVGLERVP